MKHEEQMLSFWDRRIDQPHSAVMKIVLLFVLVLVLDSDDWFDAERRRGPE
jgi:hypothetical protein